MHMVQPYVSLLFGVSPSDPLAYVGTAAVLLLVAVTAGFIPALRASRISPMAALRRRPRSHSNCFPLLRCEPLDGRGLAH
jgi:predicted lysophospholipase L1 biosynthesis ABC-type transport system permease subunit